MLIKLGRFFELEVVFFYSIYLKVGKREWYLNKDGLVRD